MAEGMSGLMPTFDVSGNNCNDGWGNWGGSLIGGAIGGAVGAGIFGGRGYNNGNCGCNNGNGNAWAGLYLMDSLSSLRSDTSSIGRDSMLQTAGLQNALCQGFGGTNTAITSLGAQIAQGQSRTEAAVLTTGLQGQIAAKDNTIATLGAAHAAEVQGLQNTYALKSSIDSCCCETQRSIDRCCCETNRNLERQGCETRTAIHAEGEATRALIQKIAYEQLQEKLCDAKAKIGSLEAQQFSSALAAGASQQARNDLNGAVTTILGHMAAFRAPTTGGTTPA